MHNIQPPYLHFLGDAPDMLAAKTSIGVHFWRPQYSVGQIRLDGCNADLGITDTTIGEAADAGAKTLVIGVANRGGSISTTWFPTLIQAMESGMDIASGLHQRLDDNPEILQSSQAHGCKLINVRQPPASLDVATGKRRSGKRLLAVGTDCSTGKMYTTLAIHSALVKANINATYRATGQTGIFIAGSGMPVDAVGADFISGSVEMLCPTNNEDHWDIIEGQGSLFHPSFAGVSLGLLHGAQADALVLCHEPTRTHMRGLSHYPLPDIGACIELNENLAKLTNPQVKTVAISVNTSNMEKDNARAYLAGLETKYGLPAIDPVVDGVDRILENIL
ncbi:MAG: N-acetyltransferase DgcN [Pseudomonadota bacterium]